GEGLGSHHRTALNGRRKHRPPVTRRADDVLYGRPAADKRRNSGDKSGHFPGLPDERGSEGRIILTQPQQRGFSGLAGMPIAAIMAANIPLFCRNSMHIIQTIGFWPGRALAALSASSIR